MRVRLRYHHWERKDLVTSLRVKSDTARPIRERVRRSLFAGGVATSSPCTWWGSECSFSMLSHHSANYTFQTLNFPSANRTLEESEC